MFDLTLNDQVIKNSATFSPSLFIPVESALKDRDSPVAMASPNETRQQIDD